MPACRMFLLGLAALAVLPASAAAYRPPRKDLGFPIYTNAPAGRQVSGQHAPAATPALSPEEAQRAFVVPPGFQVRLFAAEPEVVNPVAMTWDERGRLWVVELYEYPLGAKPGEPGRDRIKILEDTDGDGRADKVTVWADGLNLATGILLGNGGAYVGEAPNLWFMEDTNGDGRMDRKTAVLTGFGLEDRHELLNGFAWGPDGQLYMTHGVFTHTKARNPDEPAAEPVVLTAGVARFDPRTRRFEVFAEGTSNPWGVDFDAHGHAFVSACVIDHLFHLAPGGIYQRQAGQAPFPFAYENLPSIVDHRHHMAAYAGICIYQGDQWPAAWRGATLHGNIHQNALNVDILRPRGASFVASKWNDSGDFLTTPDGWFMPVSQQVGPDGAVWIMDWYDKYPCYQNANADPAGVDREHGRIWRVVWTGDDAAKPVPSRPHRDMDLAKLPSGELVKLLAHPNVWHRRTAQRLLTERRDAATAAPLHTLFTGGPNLDARLAALWTLFAAGFLDDARLALAAADREPAIRLWAARFVGEQRVAGQARFALLAHLAADADPAVRSAVATACRQFVSGQLTVNTPPPPGVQPDELGPILAALIAASRAGDDRTLAFLIWMATEPLVAASPETALGWLAENGAEFLPLSGSITAKALRRLCDMREPARLDLALEFLDRLPASAPLARFALDGLIAGQRGKAVAPARPTGPVLAKLLASPDAEIAARARELGSLWGDAAAFQAGLTRLQDPATPEAERLAALRSAAAQKSDEARRALHAVVAGANADALKVEAVRGLQQIGVDDTAKELLAGWAGYTPAVRRAVAELATTRWQWRWPFFAAVERGDVKRGDIPPTVVRTLATARDDSERLKAEQLFGKVRGTPEEKLKLIAQKRQVVLHGPVDLAAGHEVARKTCLICHQLHGEGAEMGPDLTGVGRSSLDALLHNVIHPNEIIGAGYENVEVETKDDRAFSGRLVEHNDRVVKLLLSGGAEAVIAKSDVASLRVTENSAMPEGLEQMPDADFRNLIWYILAPPQEGPLTDQRRRELSGDTAAPGSRASLPLPAGEGRGGVPRTDGESIALWNPEWRVECPDFEGAPAKLPEFAGERNVLMTHPWDADRPAALVRKLTLPAGQRAVLRFKVAAHEQGDWHLRVVADGERLHEQPVTRDGGRWQDVKLDLTRFAGRMVVLRLENAASGWNWEFGYWAALRIEEGEVAAR